MDPSSSITLASPRRRLSPPCIVSIGRVKDVACEPSGSTFKERSMSGGSESAVSRETEAVSEDDFFPVPVDSFPSMDTPIGAAAHRASQVLHPSEANALPKPRERRVLTIANQKAESARPLPPSTSPLPSRSKDSPSSSSTSIPRATRVRHWECRTTPASRRVTRSCWVR